MNKKFTILYFYGMLLAFMISPHIGYSYVGEKDVEKTDRHKKNQQEVLVRGVIVDDQGVPLVGVTVMEEGTSNGTTTDFDGNYEIVVANNESVLVFSYVGFQTISQPVGDKRNIDITLEPSTNELDELVIVGYSKVSREELTSAVATVKAEQIKDMPVNSAAEAIQGRLAGVRVTQSEGAPGADVSIRVRGGTSITQDNSPLFIVDGIQVENALSILSPQEIESIDVLKDAASTSIYGARGANGVVLITTKGGKAMPTQVTYNGYTGFRKIVNKLDVMNPYDFVQYQYELYNFPEDEQLSNTFMERYGRYQDLDIYKSIEERNWQDEIFGRDALNQTHNLTVTGGDAKTTFSLSLNHVEEEGIMLNSGYKRSLANFKMDHKLSDKIKFGVNSRYSRRKITGAGTSSTGSQKSNRLRNAVRYQPFVGPNNQSFVDVFDPNYATLTNLVNPLMLVNDEIRRDYRNDLILNSYVSFEILDNLTFKTVAGYVQQDRKENEFMGTVTSVARSNANLPVVDLYRSQSRRVTNSNTLNYSNNFGDHSIDLLVGQETVRTENESERIYVKWLPENITPDKAFASIQKATPPEGMVQDAPTSSMLPDRLASFFGRAHYSYKKKYLATFSVRRDGSSVFGPENRFATFPSVSLAWNAYKENFMQSADWLSNLKLRFSYGEVGNNRIKPFLYNTYFDSSTDYGYAFGQSVQPGSAPPSELANPNIKWESTISKNLGIDFGFFDNRVYGSLDAYITDTEDLLLRAKIPQTSGYGYQFQNSGKTRNKGLELALGATIVNTENFTWQANFNISTNQNKIISLGRNTSGENLEFYYESSGWVNDIRDFKVEVGAPVGQYYGYVTEGFYDLDDFTYDATTQEYTLRDDVPSSSAVALGSKGVNPGDLKLKDLNGDGIIDDNDKKVLGNAQPDFFGGLNQQFKYKNFDLSMFFNFSVGNDVYNANKVEFTTQYLYKDNNMLEVMNNRWKWFDANGNKVKDPQALADLNQNTTIWTPSSGQYILHSYAIEDGSFLRLSNLTFGYSLPESVLKKIGFISNFRIYGTVNNVFTLTNYTGYDPEANTRRSNPLTPGVDYAAYPRSRFYLAGVNVTF
ncbi:MULTISPECIES: SusC/RagA family TonB-linked outer membrane protein [Mesonia]|uniref:TonB-dependent receptor SusC n=1 Tax=Mesonia oceanica TaxID=2687242 RepID=A0AC61YA71_9FLAO|nr:MULTISPECIES: TonB-dependent receptor [Mesonia]MAN29398.1 SusC/RagA family TonB-linked outer membrane protein [Mesonia sp.]MAQ41571.1 SusC/RagA family TonB-linked outer membrane protein [Mesonia sp.]VVV01409.1 TonB-dependent receptor SusC [Mesonia oceanica]|tara:strand:- start:48239 stop:51523 length:3285 start_codon:yes stop_codon:yes gene_type:complete